MRPSRLLAADTSNLKRVTVQPPFGVCFPSATEDSSYVKKGSPLRRLYSTFAGGWPGTGLLLMRLVVGSALIVRASARLWNDLPPLNITIPAIALMGTGILLIVGLWTPIVGMTIAMIEIWKVLTLSGDKWVWLLMGTAGAALAMLGPGLWSIDARLFGWRRIEAPSRKTNSHPR